MQKIITNNRYKAIRYSQKRILIKYKIAFINIFRLEYKWRDKKYKSILRDKDSRILISFLEGKKRENSGTVILKEKNTQILRS